MAIGPTEEIVQLAAGKRIEGIVLSKNFWGFSTHWNAKAGKKGRSERCVAHRGDCPGCDARLPVRWKGYLYIWRADVRSLCFVELTAAACEWIELAAGKLTSLRGQWIVVRRGDGGAKTRLSVELRPWDGDLATMPPDRDPTSILENLWSWGR
jgi:hypothetical protein